MIAPSSDPARPATSTPRPVAVIDIGSTSIRMTIAELLPDGQVRTLEKLAQAVNLGKDSFAHSAILPATIEDCVRVLRTYRRLLDEYQIKGDDQIQVVATSAIREARNQLSVLDRIYSATGFLVEPIDEAEVNRITFMGIYPLLQETPSLRTATTVITEVGGGATELLVMTRGDVAFSHNYPLGSLRLREMLQTYRAPTRKTRLLMERQIDLALEPLVQAVPEGGPVKLIAMGGDVRIAATHLLPEWQPERLRKLKVKALEKFTNTVLGLTENEIVKRYHVTFQEAETLGAALLAYCQLARGMDLRELLVTQFSLRDGLLQDMIVGGSWTEEFSNQILRSAINLGRRFDFDEDHATHVALLSGKLFEALAAEHRLPPRYGLLLNVAALLHGIGRYINSLDRHKHAMYVIQHSELFGLGRLDLMQVALVARYHQPPSPKQTHRGYSQLDRNQRIAVSKMAAILRVALALESAHAQRILEMQCKVEDNRLIIGVPGIQDLSLEQLALQQQGSLFGEIFGLKVLLRPERRTRRQVS